MDHQVTPTSAVSSCAATTKVTTPKFAGSNRCVHITVVANRNIGPNI